jgi:hypothetical protein
MARKSVTARKLFSFPVFAGVRGELGLRTKKISDEYGDDVGSITLA